ncbi:glycosyltransferase [Massilia sp. W12]|uniref:glycosyltransferase n=1 Tax=Massilia sp. W12 TaxID=3126507 RepID=UPI0030D3B12C
MIKIIGHPFSSIGMGEHPRAIFQSLLSLGVNAQLVNVYPEYTGDLGTNSYKRFVQHASFRLSEEINIFAINADEVDGALSRLFSRGDNKQRFKSAYNIIYPAWELSKFPEIYYRALRDFDEVWTPSAFVQQSIAGSNTRNMPVVNMPLAVDIADPLFYRRTDLQMSEDAFVFSFFYSNSSYVQRKNPELILRAFDMLVNKLPDLDLQLYIKANPSGAEKWQCLPELEALVEKCDNRNQVKIVVEEWSPDKVYNMLRLSDAFISLHRSEGFGRGMAEAMFFETPVICTGYSGNMDFCNSGNAFLVEHELVALQAGDYPHWKDQVWAEPSLESACLQMEAVIFNEKLKAQKIKTAKSELMRNNSFAATGKRYLERLLAIQATKAPTASAA